MRLICPNCGAQYEVADDVIPAAGRDVQCSNCGNTWFEQPGASEAAEYPPEPEPVPEPPAAQPAHDPWDRSTFSRPPAAKASTAAPAGPALTADMPDMDAPVDETGEFDAPEADLPAAPSPEDEDDLPATFADAPPTAPASEPAPAPRGQVARPPMRTVTADVAEILREEAVREQAVRRAEALTGIETQPELALDSAEAGPADQSGDAPDRIARMMAASAAAQREATEPAAPSAAPTVPPSRRALLPDIEEINSTLRSATEHGPVAAEQVAQSAQSNKRGFRYGFSLILLIAAALAMVYVYTPRIIVMVPQAEPILTPYADAVDSGRLWLDLRLQDFLGMIDPAAQAPAEG